MKSVRIMVWGCIHSTGMGFLTNVEERLNGDAYIENYNMIPSVHLLSLPAGLPTPKGKQGDFKS